MVHLSECEEEYLDDRDLFHWQQKCKELEMDVAKWRRLYHELAVDVSTVAEDEYGYTDADPAECPQKAVRFTS